MSKYVSTVSAVPSRFNSGYGDSSLSKYQKDLTAYLLNSFVQVAPMKLELIYSKEDWDTEITTVSLDKMYNLYDYIGWNREATLRLAYHTTEKDFTEIYQRYIHKDTSVEKSKNAMFANYLLKSSNKKIPDKYGINLFEIKLAAFPKLCGTVIINNLNVFNDDECLIRQETNPNKVPITPIAIEIIKDFCYRMGFTTIMGSNVVPDKFANMTTTELLKSRSNNNFSPYSYKTGILANNLKNAGFTTVSTYLNARSRNRIEIWDYNFEKNTK